MNSMTLPTRANADILESAYRSWLEKPESVDATWRAFFQGFTLGTNGGLPGANTMDATALPHSLKQSNVLSLIYHYRSIGHLQAHLDPLSDPPLPSARLQLSEFKLSEADLNESFDVGHYLNGGQMKLRDVVDGLRETYCGHTGIEYIHIQDTEIRRWIQERIEPGRLQPRFS